MSRFDDHPNDHLDDASLLMLYVAGELDRDARAALENRLAVEPSLQAGLAVIQGAQDAMEASFASYDQAESLPGSVLSQRRHLAGEIKQWNVDRARAARQMPAAPRRISAWMYPISAAAILLLGFVVWWGLQPSGPQIAIVPVGTDVGLGVGEPDNSPNLATNASDPSLDIDVPPPQDTVQVATVPPPPEFPVAAPLVAAPPVAAPLIAGPLIAGPPVVMSPVVVSPVVVSPVMPNALELAVDDEPWPDPMDDFIGFGEDAENQLQELALLRTLSEADFAIP